MKTCPSCGSELADDATECICGARYEEEAEPLDVETGFEEEEGGGLDLTDESLPPIEDQGPPPTKPCVHCFSEIAGPATRCPHCSGFLPIAEGTVFKQHFFFLFCSLALAIGALLPWERGYERFNLTGLDSIAGGFLFLFAVYGMIVSFINIWHRKMIVWPVLLAAVDGAVFGWRRAVDIWSSFVPVVQAENEFGQFVERTRGYLQAIGPGLWLVVIFSSLVLLSLVLAVFKGAKDDKKRREIERQARADASRSRKTRR